MATRPNPLEKQSLGTHSLGTVPPRPRDAPLSHPTRRIARSGWSETPADTTGRSDRHIFTERPALTRRLRIASLLYQMEVYR
jgi:hypothetical protein